MNDVNIGGEGPGYGIINPKQDFEREFTIYQNLDNNLIEACQG